MKMFDSVVSAGDQWSLDIRSAIRACRALMLETRKHFSVIATQAKTSCAKPKVSASVFQDTKNRIVDETVLGREIYKGLSIVPPYAMFIRGEPNIALLIFQNGIHPPTNEAFILSVARKRLSVVPACAVIPRCKPEVSRTILCDREDHVIGDAVLRQ